MRLRGALLVVAALLAAVAIADEHDHLYENFDEVVLWMNTVGPYHNRQETYNFFSLPFCRGPKPSIDHPHETIGEALQGIDLEFSGLDIRFGVDVPERKAYCQVVLTEDNFDAFVYAVRNHYWYQMYLDDLPIWDNVGETVVPDDQTGDEASTHDRTDVQYAIWTHRHFDIGFNGKQIVDVKLTHDSSTILAPGITISFSYTVAWGESSTSFAERFDKYLDPNFFQHNIHWFSIFNSFMMVIFLVGLVSMILMRTLRKDYARYSRDDDIDDMERDLGDEYGWKQVHGDVFRAPSHLLLFSALVGSGYQLVAVAVAVICFIIVGDLYTTRGSILTTCIFAYAALSPVAGFSGGSLYARYGGREWIKQTFLTAALLPFTVSATAFMINFIAIYYNATRAIPFITMLMVLAICFFVVMPLCLVGTVLGRNMCGAANFPCRVKPVPRPIPEKQWYMEPWVIVLIGGILPFGSIFIEMYFVFTSFWAYKIYYVYGFMLLVFLILAVVTVCSTIVCTYFLLNSEDYRWHWTSFLSAASTALYVYGYSIYYFLFKTTMYGLFQTSFYFGYMALFCIGLGVLCGTIGHAGTSVFVRQIYHNVKLD
ncbi:transmembrane protein TM9SF3 [Capsaspora owczarzaki ATCC 30864]|uniref:Transmembrane 9 superfamily member n=1 Tax=Capsaspora owczarzaki (strain ATCC 30864) TaxID=595528 RepID=A0A0D2VTV6_CAPO3|nr:transmembrane protein TM9SF3 [Capsaspora owczarzaki ATCC 30864]KJE94757.1 transmembrane protein TM9SF3 [Capsaspora owczarzaki ATCC 30864]|eukprot:XP_004347030.2 transmembrane protein TM9SF3 [Capsaspora owczarzaki ATCC 30864]